MRARARARARAHIAETRREKLAVSRKIEGARAMTCREFRQLRRTSESAGLQRGDDSRVTRYGKLRLRDDCAERICRYTCANKGGHARRNDALKTRRVR